MKEEIRMAPVPARRSGFNWLAFLVVLIILVVGGWLLFRQFGSSSTLSTGDSDSYQAVFLTNNQVYFGKLVDEGRDYATLIDIFYLQAAVAPQPSQPGGQVNLVKLGSELHGPADRMKVNREHILFVEDLEAESQVVKAIEKYKADLAQE